MTFRTAVGPLCLGLAAAIVAGCGNERSPQSSGETTCESCHGNPPATGAHLAHVSATGTPSLKKVFGCKECHENVQNVNDPGHNNGTVDVPFSDPTALAGLTQPGATRAGPPAYDRATKTCSNVYCHGPALKGQAGTTGLVTAPVWTGGAQQGSCGTCHGVPPQDATHRSVQSQLQCAGCHAGAIDAQGRPDPVQHLDGKITFGATAGVGGAGGSTR